MKIDLSGKNVLVTGASRGIGKGIALGLAKAGARVAVHYHTKKSEAESLVSEINQGAKAFQANLEEVDGCQRLFDEVIKAFGHLDVLINNAGIFTTSPLSSETWADEWDQTMHVNLRSSGILSRLAILHYLEHGGGRLINIASRAAFRGDNPEHLAYAASKAGMVALTKSIARAYGKQGITSFVIAPGWVDTDMNKDAIARYGESFITDGLALSQLTTPGDLAPMVCLLASGLADHATGTTIHINAGSYMH